MKKRANGEGTIYFDEKKQIHRAMLVTPAGKRMTKSSKDESIVKDWLNEQRLLIGRNQHVEPSTITLYQWLITFVETYAKPKVRQRTYERYESLIYHTEMLWNIPIQKITPMHLQTLYNSMQEEGFSGETTKKVHQLINAAFHRAQINKYLQSNPAELVDTPKVIRKEIEIFNKDEVELLLNQAKTSKYYPFLLLAFTSGMRLGELLGLRWQDIDMKNNQVSVNQNLQNSNKMGIIFEPPKTKNSRRKITIPLQTITALKEHKKAWSQSKLKNPAAPYPDLVFVTSKHTPLLPQNFLRRFWKRVQIDVEFKMNKFEANPMSVKQKLDDILSECRKRKDWQQMMRRNFHVIRHTYATTLLAAGVPIIDVSRSLGHARVSTTLDIYGHAIPENKQMIADEIANAFLK